MKIRILWEFVVLRFEKQQIAEIIIKYLLKKEKQIFMKKNKKSSYIS